MKKILLLILIALSAFSITLLCRNIPDQEPQQTGITLTDSQFEPYLNLKGYQGEMLSDQLITIPESFTGIYQDFADTQKQAGFDLENFKGKQVRRVVYLIENYGNDTEAMAELLLYGNRLISAALIENKPEGFIIPL